MRLYVSGEGKLPEEDDGPPPVGTIPDLTQREGFGSDTPGGEGGDIFWVESLADDGGSNTLREGLSRGKRVIKFRIGGQIKLKQKLVIRDSYLTIDGLSAPTPVTITGYGLIVREAHDILIQGIRFRDTIQDGISIQYNSHHILIQQVSIHGSGDGNLDITAFKAGSTVHDITVAWSILARPAGTGKNMLIKYNNPHRISLHHNLFISARQRNPQMRSDAPSGDVNLDFRHNVIWQWPGGYGTLIYGAKANVVGNYYASDDRPNSALLVNNGAEVFARDNVSGDGVDIDVMGNKSSLFPSAPVTTTSVCDAAAAVLESSGVQPRDDIDQGYVDTVELPLCP
jgi:pectate lyase